MRLCSVVVDGNVVDVVFVVFVVADIVVVVVDIVVDGSGSFTIFAVRG